MSKVELTRAVVQMLEKSGVVFPEDRPAYMSEEHRRKYPNGFAREGTFDALSGTGGVAIESELGCFESYILRMIESYPVVPGVQYDALYSEWGQQRLLFQSPRIIEEYGRTTLMLRHNIYAMLGNGCFYVADDVTGRNVKATSSMDMKQMAQVMRFVRREADTCSCLWYSYLAETAMAYYEFHNLVLWNPSLIGAFLKKCAEQNPGVYTGGLAKAKFGNVFRGCRPYYVDEENLLSVGLEVKDNIYFGKLDFGASHVSLEIYLSGGTARVFTFTFPKWEEDSDLFDFSEFDPDLDGRCGEREWYQRFMWKRYAVLLLTYSGVPFNINRFYLHRTRALGYRKPGAGWTAVRSLGELYALIDH